ncbi:hypothetical protein KUTeg_000625, partial [Tegillarca granosa]
MAYFLDLFTTTTDTMSKESKNNPDLKNKNLEDRHSGLDSTEDINTSCGIGRCRPGCIQCCAGIFSFSLVFGLGQLINQSLPSYLTSQITTIEKQYNISSSLAGFMVSASDVGFAKHIPKLLGICTIVFGLSSLLTVVPPFITSQDMLEYTSLSSSNFSLLCDSKFDPTKLSIQCDVDSSRGSNLTWVIVCICLCFIVQGACASPRGSLGTIYVDDNVERKRTGIVTTIGLFGPFIALVLGGLFLQIPVDLKKTTLTILDPRWIGAWWIGFILYGVLGIICGFLYLLFPKYLKQKYSDTEVEKASKSNKDEQGAGIKEMGRSFIRIISNPVLFFNLIGADTAMLSAAVLSSFGPKYFEIQYNIPATQANIILDLYWVVTVNLCLTWQCVVLMAIHIIHLAMLAVPMSLRITMINGTAQAKPGICDSGCQNFIPFIITNIGHLFVGTMAIMPVYIAFLRKVGHVKTLIKVEKTANMSVEDGDRALCIGIVTFSLALFVYIPGPLLVGYLFDTACKIWRRSCGISSACALYDVVDIRYKLISLDFGLNVLTTILNLFALIAAISQSRKLQKNGRKPISSEFSPDITNQSNDG